MLGQNVQKILELQEVAFLLFSYFIYFSNVNFNL